MATTGLHGPHALTAQGIDAVFKSASPGAYALGRQTAQGYYVDYVGRSDSDLPARLKQWAATGRYPHFKAGYLQTAQAAFEYECRLYHDFGGGTKRLDNDIHPARPQGSNWLCPHC